MSVVVYNFAMSENQSASDQIVTAGVAAPDALISDEMLLGIYSEILDTIRQDRVETTDILNNFCEMVLNEGDGSAASKDAIVQLVKTKMDAADKMAKVAELMTRVKMRDRESKFITTPGGTVVNIGDGGTKKELLRRLNSAQKTRKKETNHE